ncbi:MAG TPA: FHA domain-containing protein [Caulobacteraceae bacterium]|nr:FHA domain-containing protein [Caulobacteraceae bacterium]
MSPALALALLLATNAPAPQKNSAVNASSPAKASAHKRPKADPCQGVDAAAIPACLPGRMPSHAAAPPVGASIPEKRPEPEVNAPAPTPTVVATRPPARAPAVKEGKATVVKPPAKSKRAAESAAELIRGRPILVGGASGLLAVAIIGAGVFGISRARRAGRAAAAPASPDGSAPTRWRRDLVLVDEEGRDWRIAGAHLTPSAVVGSDADCALRRIESGVAGHHAEFWVRDGRLMLRRLADPVFLNDRRLSDITPEVVSTGDQLRLGSTTFTITID